MNEQLFNIVLLLIPVIGAVITGIFIPYLKTRITSTQFDQKAVEAAEVMFDVPDSGEQKREYVINFIDKMFNGKKEVITKDQIRILLESAWKQMNNI